MTTRLDVHGMTCAACVSHVEQQLNALDGVRAQVNLATEIATVEGDAPVEAMLAAVESAGYRASVHEHGGHQHEDYDPRGLQRRLIVSAPLALAVLIVAMGFGGPGWLEFLLATPVAGYGAWPFHRAAMINARHLRSTMDTLVSIGIVAAWTWSTVALFTGGDRYFEVGVDGGCRSCCRTHAGGAGAAGVRSRVAGAARAGRQGASRCCVDGVEVAVPVAELVVGRRVRGPAGREDRHRRRGRRRRLAVDASC